MIFELILYYFKLYNISINSAKLRSSFKLPYNKDWIYRDQ